MNLGAGIKGNVLAPDFFYYLIPFKKVIKFGDSLNHAIVTPYSAFFVFCFCFCFKSWLPEAQPEFTLYVVHWRREWQATSVFLPWEPHEQYEKAK